jgi:site-specific recombinase XerD
VDSLGLAATFRSLRHADASQLIASGLDVITIRRRLGRARRPTAKIMEASFLKDRE